MKKFMIGASTAAHQVEGNNFNSDSWAQENMEKSAYVERSTDAVDHYNKFKDDIDYLTLAGLNSFRFTIEWARIEPEKGCFDDKEINHYREVLEYCHTKNITPIVTLHHFSSPLWLIKEGGWESTKTISYFIRYAEYVVKQLGDLMEYICTINEANMGTQIANKMKSMMGENVDLQIGVNLDKFSDPKQDAENMENFGTKRPQHFLSPAEENRDYIVLSAHEKTRDLIKTKYPHLKIGITLSLHDFQAVDGGEKQAEKEWYQEFLQYIPYIEKDDFFGVQNYTRKVIDKKGVRKLSNDTRKTAMGYEFYPLALPNVIRKVAQFLKTPLLVTENGIATDDDKERIEFIQVALNGVKECIRDGINVIGYLHWSLLDNFEWQKGFSMKFGLIEVDRSTQTRYPKESLMFLEKCFNEE